MRRQRYLRTSSAQSLCIFCACRLAGDLPAVLTPAPAPFATARRRLNTTRSSNQSAGAAAAQAPSHDAATTGAGGAQWAGFDPNSSLTLSEQREKAMLRERREARDREAREAAEAQWRKEEEAARALAAHRRAEQEARKKVQREEQVRIAEAWRQDQEAAQHAEAAKQAAADAEAKRTAEGQRQAGRMDKRERMGGTFRLHKHTSYKGDVFEGADGSRPSFAGNTTDTTDPRTTTNPQTAAQGTGDAHYRLDLSSSVSRRSLGDGQSGARQRDTRKSPPGAQQPRRFGDPIVPRAVLANRGESKNSQRRFGDPFAPAPASASHGEPKQPQKVAMPAFGSGASSQQQGVPPKLIGWGAGPVERTPLKHGEEVVRRRNPNIMEEDESRSELVGVKLKQGGWGAGSAGRAPLRHGDQVGRRNANITEESDSPRGERYEAQRDSGGRDLPSEHDHLPREQNRVDPSETSSQSRQHDTPQHHDREAQRPNEEPQDFGWDAQADGQTNAWNIQQQSTPAPQRDYNDFSGLSGAISASRDDLQQHASSASPDALNAAFEGRGQQQGSYAAQRPQQPRLSRDPLADRGLRARAPSRQDGSSSALGTAFEGRGEQQSGHATQQPQRSRLSRDPLGSWGSRTQAPSSQDASSTALGAASEGNGQQPQQSRLSREPLADRDLRAQAPSSQYQFSSRPQAVQVEEPRPALSGRAQDNGWSSASNGLSGWDQVPGSPAGGQTSRDHDPWTSAQAPQRDGLRDSQSRPDDWFGRQDESRPPQRQETTTYRPPPRPTQSADSLGSYQPPPPPRPQRQSEQSTFNDSGYQATMFDPQTCQQPESRFDDDQATNWQHLRRRDSAPPPLPNQQNRQQQVQQPRQQQAAYGDEWIDRQFQAHIQQRTAQQPPFGPASTAPGAQEFDERRMASPTRAQQRCGRCGEVGHVARECNGPIRSKCNICGEAGHNAYDCVQNPKSAAYRNTQQGRERNRRRDPPEGGDPFASRGNASGGERGVVRRTQSEGPSPFREMKQPEEPADMYSGRVYARRRFDDIREDTRDRAPRGRQFDEEEDALSDVRDRVLRRPAVEPAAKEDGAEEEERPSERTLRSRKFADDVPAKKEKAGRVSRRRDDDEKDDEGGAARDERNARKASRKADKEKAKADQQAKAAERKAKQVEARSQVKLPEFVSVATLAQTLGVRYESFVARLERLGYDDIFRGKVFNAETSGMIAMEYDFEPVFESGSPEAEERDLKARPEVEDQEFLPTRPPVVTIMGHVDHGKTTILDYLRKSSVAAGEAGGITQHIGAFSVPLASSGKTITFLDTPGHAAFLAMRQRGANVTDIVILVVAADDSVKPQTLEAIKHAKAANVPMIVAVNKIDKEEADLQRVKQDLARHGVEIEDFGGETQVVPVSGKTGVGMEELEESVVTLSEILDHRAETDGSVEGWVLEATTKKAGRVATVLVRRGTLKVGAVIVAGKTWARVRTLRNEGGQTLKEIGPGMPVEVDGWRDQPAAGDEVLQAPTEQKASDVVEFRLEREEREKTAADMEAINEARRLEQEKREKEKLAEQAKKRGDQDALDAAALATEEATEEERQTGQMHVPFIIKADVSGSAEAVSAYILSVASPLIAPRVLRSQVGGINESDVELAAAAQGHIISFNLPADEGMKGQAEARGVKVLENNIIYRVLDDVKAVLEEKLPPIVTQRVLGEAEISAAFEIGVGGRKTVKIAGCKVRNGVVGRGSRVRVLRGSTKIFDGTINSLKNVKKDVQEMRKGTECGMGFEGWEAFEVGDQVQTYEEVIEKRRL